MDWKVLLSFHPVRIYSLPTMSGAEDVFDSLIRSPFQGRFFLVPVKLWKLSGFITRAKRTIREIRKIRYIRGSKSKKWGESRISSIPVLV